ncbi:Hypothetical predicted protein [Octopus vulgaris]|uniref:Histone-lysine N-methyltransferase SETMAR-like n=1 Tax=Octopus vulgaris TaxID=6645 RepID=A0AA36F5U3_OCTVU|nr:Hypothetical predicted protein [Octopus vulgaris]
MNGEDNHGGVGCDLKSHTTAHNSNRCFKDSVISRLYRRPEDRVTLLCFITDITAAQENAVSESTVRRWFAEFKAGEFILEADSRTGRPSKLDDFFQGKCRRKLK